MKKETALILSDIRSVHNVGSIFRTADCAGVSKIYLCGTTPAPLDRFGRKRKDFAKVSLGAEESVVWEYSPDAAQVIRRLKKEGFEVIALEQDRNSVDYRTITPKSPSAIICGNEVDGVPKNILKLCDRIAEIPMKGKKESLNVSVAMGVLLFELLG